MKKIWMYVLCALALASSACLLVENHAFAAAINKVEKIHVVSQDYMDAIVLESVDADGAPIFGIVDSGQGDTWPDGTDSRYPDRPGITKGGSIQAELLNYLTQLGVTSENLDFYLGTHVHSDHIGTAQAVIKQFQPKRVYMEPYRDSLINVQARLWDNLFQYDQLRKAAAQVGATFIQYFDDAAYVDPVRDPVTPVAPSKTTTLDGYTIKAYTAKPTFDLGSMQIDVMHYMDIDGAPNQSLRDANSLSLGVKVTSLTTAQTAFLAGDIDNYESSYAPANKAEDQLASKLGHIDFLKLGHHGLEGSNTEGYLNALRPKIAFMTGDFSLVPQSTYVKLLSMNTRFYQAPESRSAAHFACTVDLSVVQNGAPSIVDTGNSESEAHLRTSNDGANHTWYYVNGLPKVASGILKDGNTWSYFEGHAYATQSKWFWYNNNWAYVNDKGIMPHDQWASVQDSYGSHWYYFDANGNTLRNTWFRDPSNNNLYFLDNSGYMLTGWQWLDDAWHFFAYGSGNLYTGWNWIDGAAYYLEGEHGDMAHGGWFWKEEAWRYFDNSGHLYFGWNWIGDAWYYLDPGNWGAMLHSGWKLIDNTWYFLNDSGRMLTGWQWIGWAWFYLGTDGAMRTGWQWVGSAWYYLDSDGHMKTGWFQVGSTWYYCYSNGVMAHDCWIDGYWLNSDGSMA